MDSSAAVPDTSSFVASEEDHTLVSSFPTRRVTDGLDASNGATIAAQAAEDAFPMKRMRLSPRLESEPAAQDLPTTAEHPPPKPFPPFQPFPEYQFTQYPPPPLAKDEDRPFKSRKSVRAAQACDNCRTRKARCDEERPQCALCKDNSLNCHYRDIHPPKLHQRDEALHDKLSAMQVGLDKVLGLFSTLSIDRDLEGDEHGLLGHFGQQAALPVFPAEKLILEDLDERLRRLSMSPQWPLMRSRLIR